MIYILIEHQSEPDRLMPLRTVDYVVQIYKFRRLLNGVVQHLDPWLDRFATAETLDEVGIEVPA